MAIPQTDGHRRRWFAARRGTLKPLRLLTACLLFVIFLFAIPFAGRTRRPSDPVVPAAVADLILENTRRLPHVIAAFRARPLTTSDMPWYLLHGLLGHGSDFPIHINETRSISTVTWLLEEASWQGEYGGISLLERDSIESGIRFVGTDSVLRAKVFEGHFGQGLYCLWCAGVDPLKTMVKTPPVGDTVIVRDLVQTLKRDCHELSDLSWALPVLAVWCDEKKWHNRFGSVLTMDSLLDQHLQAEERCKACFGTHWRMAIAVCVRVAPRRFSRAVLNDAAQRLTGEIEQARLAQTPTGQFTSDATVESGVSAIVASEQMNAPDRSELAVTMQAHTLEWLSVAATDEVLLTQPWIHLGIRLLIEQMETDATVSYDIHAHGCRALRLYDERITRLQNRLHVQGATSQ